MCSWVERGSYRIPSCYIHKVTMEATTAANPHRKGGCHLHTGVSKPFNSGRLEHFGTIFFILWQTLSILSACPDGEVNLPYCICFTPWRKPRWPHHPTPRHWQHTITQTDAVSFHNDVVIWGVCVCMGRASHLTSVLFAAGVLWLHLQPGLTPHTCSQTIGLNVHIGSLETDWIK